MNDKAHRPVATTNHPPCPAWCFHHIDDLDTVAIPPSPARFHAGPVRRAVVHADPAAVVHLELTRSDFDLEAGEPGIKVTLIEQDGEIDGDLLPGPMPLDGCRELIAGLAELIDIAESQPEIPAQRTTLASGLREFLVSTAVTR